MSSDWRDYIIATDNSHHVYEGSPAYASRFLEVLKFHAPGLAPVVDHSGAYHITPNGQPAYEPRYVRTFGYYEGRAAVHSADGWFHILPDGSELYPERYAWCGNFQEGRCAVRLSDNRYFHIREDGVPAYTERYRYAGDFKDGFAVVQRNDGRHSHIDRSGALLHGRWFLDLDVFHKQYARARDEAGWHHVDQHGEPIYGARFRNVEPFYNGQARAEGFDGSLAVVCESGELMVELRQPLISPLQKLSSDMVGMWKTQAILAALEVGVFEILPASAHDIEITLNLADSIGIRLMRALTEMDLVWRDADGIYHSTKKGSLLKRANPLSLADAVRHWGKEAYGAWSGVTQSLRTSEASFDRINGKKFFDWIHDRPVYLQAYHSAMSTYARHDYEGLADSVDFTIHDSIVDVGGGTGELSFSLLRSCPALKATVMDRAEVVETASLPADLTGRCRFVAGDLFQEWPVTADAVILARVIHDWPDSGALQILRRARQTMSTDTTLYLIELVLDEASGMGGLLDLNMLVMTGGAERTEAQYRGLLDQSGFELLEVIPTNSVSSVIRARAV